MIASRTHSSGAQEVVCRKQNLRNPNGIRVPLREPYFSQIADKTKTIEGRINSGQFKAMQPGERILFIHGKKELPCTVVGKRVYSTFREMLAQEGVKNCLPGLQSIDAAVAIYHALPGFALRARQHGVVALEIHVREDSASGSENSKSEEGKRKREEEIHEPIKRRK